MFNAKRKSKRIAGEVKDAYSDLRSEQREGNAGDKTKINQLISDMIKTTIADMEHEREVGKPITRGERDDRLNKLNQIEHDWF